MISSSTRDFLLIGLCSDVDERRRFGTDVTVDELDVVVVVNADSGIKMREFSISPIKSQQPGKFRLLSCRNRHKVLTRVANFC